MRTNSSIILFLAIFVALVALVNGQSSTTPTETTTNSANPTPSAEPNKIAQCIKDNNCAEDDQKCRAQCAGVPDPSVSQANATNECASKCNQNDTKSYNACMDQCKQIYFPNSTAPAGTTPSGNVSTVNTASATASGASGSPSASGSANSSSTPKAASAAISQYKENLYPLMLLVVCVVAGMFGTVFEIIC